MEGARMSAVHVPPREEVIRRIEALAKSFVDCITEGRLMDMETLRRTSDAMEYDEENERLVHKQETRMLRLSRGGARKYTATWLVLQTAHELLLEQKTVTQRELYYLHPFFKSQSEADEAIIDAGCILRVPRSSLNIFGATKGCFTGCLEIRRDDCWKNYNDNDEHPITQLMLHLAPADVQSNAVCIIVVEKDGIFHRLRDDRFCKRVPSIIITGRGFPDLGTRMFVSMLKTALGIPVYGLSDCNPFGLSIMLTYRIGSARMPIDTQPYTIDLRWIGLRPSTINELNLPEAAFKDLTSNDLRTARSLADSRFVKTHNEYHNELMFWISTKLPFKIELEALHLLGFGFLSDFVEKCIVEQEII